jgi:hypothetical protein
MPFRALVGSIDLCVVAEVPRVRDGPAAIWKRISVVVICAAQSRKYFPSVWLLFHHDLSRLMHFLQATSYCGQLVSFDSKNRDCVEKIHMEICVQKIAARPRFLGRGFV